MPKVVDHEVMKKNILDGSFELFCRKGYTKVTIREVARELNISPGMLYHYFPTKQSLLEGLFLNKPVEDIQELSHLMGEDVDRTKAISMFMDRWESNKHLYQNFIMLAIDYFRDKDCQPDMEVFKEFSDFYTKTISSFFQIDEQMGRMIVTFLIGLYYHTLLGPKTIDMAQQLVLFKRIFDAYDETSSCNGG